MSKEKKPKCKVQNLVILKYDASTCYTKVVKLCIKKLPDEVLSVDPDNGTWQMKIQNFSRKQGTRLHIGKDVRRCKDGCKYGVIGIYDKTIVSHLNKMVYDAQEATREKASCVYD